MDRTLRDVELVGRDGLDGMGDSSVFILEQLELSLTISETVELCGLPLCAVQKAIPEGAGETK